MKNWYRVSAWDWNRTSWRRVNGELVRGVSDLRKQFGEPDRLHELSDAEVIEAIKKHGRASIWVDNDELQLEFQNDYD